jgi:transposase
MIAGRAQRRAQRRSDLECGQASGVVVQKALCASEQDWPDVAARRKLWRAAQPFLDPESLVFLDETGVNTKMARLYGCSPVGERCRDSAPFGHLKMMTFVAGLRLTGMTAPWVLDRAMDGDAFRTYVQHVLALTLRRGDVVVLDNLPAHKVAAIREAITNRRAQIFYLPPYSPDMNPIEMAFSKLKALLWQEPARTVDGLIERIGTMLDRFLPDECANFFQAAGYQRSS